MHSKHARLLLIEKICAEVEGGWAAYNIGTCLPWGERGGGGERERERGGRRERRAEVAS